MKVFTAVLATTLMASSVYADIGTQEKREIGNEMMALTNKMIELRQSAKDQDEICKLGLTKQKIATTLISANRYLNRSRLAHNGENVLKSLYNAVDDNGNFINRDNLTLNLAIHAYKPGGQKHLDNPLMSALGGTTFIGTTKETKNYILQFTDSQNATVTYIHPKSGEVYINPIQIPGHGGEGNDGLVFRKELKFLAGDSDQGPVWFKGWYTFKYDLDNDSMSLTNNNNKDYAFKPLSGECSDSTNLK